MINMYIVSLLLTVPLMTIFYGYFIYISLKRQKLRYMRKSFFHAIISILENVSDTPTHINQMNLNFKKLSQKYLGSVSEVNVVDLLEDFIHYYDISGEHNFTERFDLEVTSEIRNVVMGIIEIMKEENPFISLSPKDANIFITLRNSINDQNSDLALTTLKQLAEEIETKENTIKLQRKKNDTAYIVATLGVILTIFFGLISFVKFL